MEEPSSIFWGVVLIGVLVGVNAFFVAAEYALVRVRRTQIEAMAAQGSRAATVVLYGLDHISRYIAGVQVGITLAGLASGLFGEPALAALIDPVAALFFPLWLLGRKASNALSTSLTPARYAIWHAAGRKHGARADYASGRSAHTKHGTGNAASVRDIRLSCPAAVATLPLCRSRYITTPYLSCEALVV